MNTHRGDEQFYSIPCAPNKFFGATSFPKNLKLDKDEFENFGGVWRPGEGVSRFRPAAPPCFVGKGEGVSPCIVPRQWRGMEGTGGDHLCTQNDDASDSASHAADMTT